jgi:hypothetical protein
MNPRCLIARSPRRGIGLGGRGLGEWLGTSARVLLRAVEIVMIAGWLAWQGPRTAEGADAVFTEPRIKAALVYNFAKYVEWPAQVFAQTNTPLVMGVLGDRTIFEALEKTVAGRTIDGHPVTVRYLDQAPGTSECHVLFVGASDRDRESAALAQTKAKPVLTVGEGEDFLSQGGVVRLLMVERKLRFHINLAAARDKQLGINSQLLRLADQVVRKKP